MKHIEKLQGISVNDMVINEYNHVGKVIELNWPNEAIITVINYGIDYDYDYCDVRKCRKATDSEILKALGVV